MKNKRFTEEQIAYALRQAESGTPAKELCRKLGVSQATFYAWRKKYGGLGTSDLLGVLESGTSQSAIVHTLRESGLQVSLRYKLDFKSLVRAIDQNKLVIGYLFNEEHWLVIYGYGHAPERLFVADPRPGFEKHEHTFAEYEGRLRGFGMLCSERAKPRFTSGRTSPSTQRPQQEQLLLPLCE